jgi:uncharacterized protein (DUF433 family)
MSAEPVFTPREVADLSGAPKRVIEKAIEERVLRPSFRNGHRTNGRARRMLPAYAVAYAAIVSRLDLKLTTAQKKRLASGLARLRPAAIGRTRIEVAPAVEVNVGRLAGDAMTRARRYRSARDVSIVTDERILGGTPVIRGTRVTVYSKLGRVEHGDTIEEILADNPDFPRVAVEAAIIYARTHPLIGRPGGRPWPAAA